MNLVQAYEGIKELMIFTLTYEEQDNGGEERHEKAVNAQTLNTL